MENSSLFYVFWVGNMVTTSFLQTLGFLSPHWVCNIDKSNVTSTNDSCEIDGLFYPSGVLDNTVFGMCLAVLVVSGLCTAANLLRFIGKMRSGDEDVDILDKIASVVFLICQFIAGIANYILLSSYDVLGWSAILFFTFAFPLFVIVTGIITICVVIYCCTQSSSDDD